MSHLTNLSEIIKMSQERYLRPGIVLHNKSVWTNTQGTSTEPNNLFILFIYIFLSIALKLL